MPTSGFKQEGLRKVSFIYYLTLCMSAHFFKINFFEKLFQEYHQPDMLTGLFWLRSVGKIAKFISRQQVAASRERVN